LGISAHSQEGQVVAVHPLSTPPESVVDVPVAVTHLLPSVGMGEVGAVVQLNTRTLEEMFVRNHPTARALDLSPTNVSSLSLTVQSPVFAQQALVLQGGGVSNPIPPLPVQDPRIAVSPSQEFFTPAPLNLVDLPIQTRAIPLEPTPPERGGG
jgi:hypothetical protein